MMCRLQREERQAAKPPNQTQKLQPPATSSSQEVASQEEATTGEWQRSQDVKLAAKQAKSKLTKLVRSQRRTWDSRWPPDMPQFA